MQNSRLINSVSYIKVTDFLKALVTLVHTDLMKVSLGI